MNRINNLKAQRGFTLVEVIVVAIIVAALAGVAIPMYTSYVNSSRQNAAANAAGSVASFMGACVNQGGNVGTGAIAKDGKKPDSLVCVIPSDTSAHPKMQLPQQIAVSISSGEGPTGVVTATHNGGGAAQTYNY